MFHFVGLGFSVFENSYSTLYLKLSRPTSIDHVGIQALKISMHHSMYISTLHCVCCALTASQIFRRDFYGGYELVNRGRHILGYLHILAPAVLVHGSFDLIAFLVKMHIQYQYTFGNNTYRRHRAVRVHCHPNRIAFGVYTVCRACFGEAKYI